MRPFFAPFLVALLQGKHVREQRRDQLEQLGTDGRIHRQSVQLRRERAVLHHGWTPRRVPAPQNLFRSGPAALDHDLGQALLRLVLQSHDFLRLVHGAALLPQTLPSSDPWVTTCSTTARSTGFPSSPAFGSYAISSTTP